MKNKFNYLFKALFIFISLLFLGCETQEEVVSSSENFRKYQINFDEFNVDKNAKSALDQIKEEQIQNRQAKSGDAQQRIMYNKEFDFYIDTEKIVVVENSNYRQYTFPIYRTSENVKLENLVIKSKNNEPFKAYTIKYTLTALEKEIISNGGYVDVSDDTEISTLSKFAQLEDGTCWETVTVTSQATGWDDETWQQVPCPGSLSGGGGSGYIPNFNTGNGGIGSFPTGDTSGNGGGFQTSGGGSYSNINYIVATPVASLEQSQIKEFINSLSDAQHDFLFPDIDLNNLSNEETSMNKVETYFSNNDVLENQEFIKNLIDYCLDEDKSTESINAFNTTLDLINSNNFLNIGTEASNAIISSNLNDHWPSIGTYGFMMAYNTLVLQEMQLIMSTYPVGHEFTTKEYALIYLEAQTEAMHLALDILGMTPVVGPVFDVTNGVWYTFNGDFVNAGMSYTAVVPFFGDWTTVSRITKRIYTIAGSRKVILKAYLKLDGTIVFSNRGQLRKMLGLTNLAYHAHHIIPYSLSTRPLVQKAAKFCNDVKKAWHPNDIANGIPLLADFHLNGHAAYTAKIETKLNELNEVAGDNIELAWDLLTNYMNEVRAIIVANPNLSLGEIALLLP
ncbi:AHH domain-containing protein [Flavobacterium sp.]|uniref:AHH domain-containing protein n=1 Tax=Flavobacterium sp. TaxID=239 RepID=UPI002616D08F|nr:AHH domain-containing protein [Flavobacterium sp.]